MELARGIIDYAENDNAKEMRDAFYAALQDKVMAHIETHKVEVARNLFNSQEDTQVETQAEIEGDDGESNE